MPHGAGAYGRLSYACRGPLAEQASVRRTGGAPPYGLARGRRPAWVTSLNLWRPYGVRPAGVAPSVRRTDGAPPGGPGAWWAA